MKGLHLKMLTDRRKWFMLSMMYKLSLIKENVNTYRPERQLCTGPKVKYENRFHG